MLISDLLHISTSFWNHELTKGLFPVLEFTIVNVFTLMKYKVWTQNGIKIEF